MSYFGIAVNILAGLVYTPWVMSTIGESGYGLYTLASSLLSMFMVDFGIGSAVSKYISQYLVEGNQKKIDNFLGIIYKLYFMIDAAILFVFTVVYFNISTIYSNLSPNEISSFKVVFIIIACYNLISFPFVTLNGILTSYEKFFQLKLCDILNKLGTVTTTIAALALGKGLFALVIINVLWNMLAIIFKLYIVKRDTTIRINFRYWNRRELRSLFSFSIWATVISIMSRLVFNIMPSILAALSGASSVALFGIAATLEGYVYTFSEAVNGMFLPKTVRVLYSKNQEKDMLDLMIRVGRINFSIVALVIVGFGVAGREFIRLWLGEGYEIIYMSTMLMILPSLVYSPQQIGRTALIARDKIKYQAYIYMIVCILNVIAACILCPDFGALGGGIAIGVTYSLRLILMTAVFDKILKLDMRAFFWNCYFKMALPVILTAVSGIFIFHIIQIHSWYIFLTKCCVVGILYLALMWFLAWNQYEKNIILDLLKAVKRKIHSIV